MAIEIVIFKDKRFDKIPKQDNPAFDYKHDNPKHGRKHHCLMISKVLPYEHKGVGENGFVVTEIPLVGDVIRHGLFWDIKLAEIFAEALSEFIIDISKVDNLEFSDVEHDDYPDYSNAFICSADYNGCEMTEKELDILNDDRSFVYESLMEHLH